MGGGGGVSTQSPNTHLCFLLHYVKCPSFFCVEFFDAQGCGYQMKSPSHILWDGTEEGLASAEKK